MARSRTKRAHVRIWASENLASNIRQTIDRLARCEDVQHIAIMPDVHLARGVCVGTVFATSRMIYPSTIGGDIGCGMATMALNATGDDHPPDCKAMAQLLRHLQQAVPIQRHRGTDQLAHRRSVLPDPSRLSAPSLVRLAETEGLRQLGSLGTGNHFLELQHDEESRLWLMVHSGSRAMGQEIRRQHEPARGKGTSLGLGHLDAESEAGQHCLNDMEWARTYAATSRRTMLQAAGQLMGTMFGWQMLHDTLIDCDHNHITRETHCRRELLVHRKGAMPAFPGQPGLLPGSMATASFHVVGRGNVESLCSSAHGAGRAMSRSQARRSVSMCSLTDQLRHVHYDPERAASLREEAPSAYKDIHQVLRNQRRLVRVTRTLTPILSHKGA